MNKGEIIGSTVREAAPTQTYKWHKQKKIRLIACHNGFLGLPNSFDKVIVILISRRYWLPEELTDQPVEPFKAGYGQYARAVLSSDIWRSLQRTFLGLVWFIFAFCFIKIGKCLGHLIKWFRGQSKCRLHYFNCMPDIWFLIWFGTQTFLSLLTGVDMKC